jgi:hypothetical protein
VPEGFQIGSQARSYAILTVVRPSGPVVPMAEIETQFVRLWDFAKQHLELTFLLTEVGAGLAGHRRGNLREILDAVINEKGLPRNIQNASEVYRQRNVSILNPLAPPNIEELKHCSASAAFMKSVQPDGVLPKGSGTSDLHSCQ